MTYFYNSKDEYADAAKQVLAVTARRNAHLRVRSLDLDTEFTAARDYGVKLYNTVVVEAQGRRAQVENIVDLRQMAYAIERVLQQRTQMVCFMTVYDIETAARGCEIRRDAAIGKTFSRMWNASHHSLPHSSKISVSEQLTSAPEKSNSIN